MELNFKTMAFIMLLLGGGYAWHIGLIDDFFGGFSGSLSGNSGAAKQIEE